MSEIKALDALREELKVCGCDPDECMSCSVPRKVKNSLADVEREIAERYMLAPVDADGVPIRVGDSLSHADEREFNVNGITFYHNSWRVISNVVSVDGGFSMRYAKDCHHVKPRTLEDVLRDVVTLCANTWKDEKSAFRYYDVGNVMESGNIADFADEIREIMGEG